MRNLALLTALMLGSLWLPGAAQELEIDRTRSRKLEAWKPLIQGYSERHYGESTWQLMPTCIVLHYTVTRGFPWNLVRSGSFNGETPGLAVHYVIDGQKIWEILPPDVRSRGAYGINHRAINIEMIADDADDLATKTETMKTCQRLVQYLMKRHGIAKDHIYSHQDVATMNRKIVPEVLDLINGAPYHKIDPGQKNMEFILQGL
ncbi:MAG: peptidoglycan recognition family protein [Vulcanimicrobiota bacterium]